MEKELEFVGLMGVGVKGLYTALATTITCVSLYLGLDILTLKLFTSLIILDTILVPVNTLVMKQELVLRKIVVGFISKLSLLLLPVLVAILLKILDKETIGVFGDISILDFTIGVVTFTLGYSVLRSIYSLYNKGTKQLPQIDFIGIGLDKIKKILEKNLDV